MTFLQAWKIPSYSPSAHKPWFVRQKWQITFKLIFCHTALALPEVLLKRKRQNKHVQQRHKIKYEQHCALCIYSISKYLLNNEVLFIDPEKKRHSNPTSNYQPLPCNSQLACVHSWISITLQLQSPLLTSQNARRKGCSCCGTNLSICRCTSKNKFLIKHQACI